MHECFLLVASGKNKGLPPERVVVYFPSAMWTWQPTHQRCIDKHAERTNKIRRGHLYCVCSQA